MVIDIFLLIYIGFSFVFRIDCAWHWKLVGAFFLIWGLRKLQTKISYYFDGCYPNGWWGKVLKFLF